MALTWEGGVQSVVSRANVGVVLTLYPNFDILTGLSSTDPIEVQRAPDNAGAPGTPVLIDYLPPIPARGQVYTDPRPLSTAVWWYRHRHVRAAGNLVGSWSGWQAGLARIIVPGDQRLDVPPSANAGGMNTSTRYRCSLYQNTGQSINSGAATILNFDSENYDNGNLHDNSVNPSRVTIPSVNYLGLWLLYGSVSFPLNATGYRLAALTKNTIALPGGATWRSIVSAAIAEVVPVHAFVLDPAPGDYLQLLGTQTSGGPLTVNGTLDVVHIW